MTISRKKILFTFIVFLFLCGLGIIITIRSIHQTYYSFTAKLPDLQTMNITKGVPFDDVSTRSVLTVTACVTNKVRPGWIYEPPYIDGRLVNIHIISSTQILDQRGRTNPIAANIESLQPGQSIQVWTTDIPVFAGDAVAKEIIIHSDGMPEQCEPYWVKEISSQ